MCVKNDTIIYVARASNSKRDCNAWSLLLLAATVQSFAHMLLGISNRNNVTHKKPEIQTLQFSKIPKSKTPRIFWGLEQLSSLASYGVSKWCKMLAQAWFWSRSILYTGSQRAKNCNFRWSVQAVIFPHTWLVFIMVASHSWQYFALVDIIMLLCLLVNVKKVLKFVCFLYVAGEISLIG